VTDDEDVMRNVQREKKLSLDLVFFIFTKVSDMGVFPKGNQWKTNGNQRKILEISENQKYQIELKLFLSLHVSHHIFVVSHTF